MLNNFFVIFLYSLAIIVGCEQAKEKSSEDADGSSQAHGALEVSGEEIEGGIETAGSNLATVSDGMVPKSMQAGAVDVGAGLALLDGPPQFCQNNPSHNMCQQCGPGGSLQGSQQCMDFFSPGGEGYTEGENTASNGSDQGGNTGEGPCEGLTFFGCQGALVKIYTDISKQMLSETLRVLRTDIKQIVKAAQDKEGNLDSSEMSVDYRIESPKDMEFYVKDHGEKEYSKYYSIKDNTYHMKSLERGTSENGGDVSVKVTYVDEKSWELEVGLKMACKENDPQAPNHFVINITRKSDVWYGKSMMHSSHWPEGKCSDPITDESSFNIFTDFVGEEKFTTASLYLMSTDVEALDNSIISDYSVEKVCENVDHQKIGCDGNGQAMGDILPDNPFCTTPDGAITWETKCSDSSVEDVASGNYGTQEAWRAPSELKNFEVEISKK